jgi:hypothetical protein
MASDSRGQASVELVAVLPLVVVLAAALWQAALAGQAAWLSANAARVAARADVVERDRRAAARSALPSWLEHGLRVERRGRRVRVSVRVPLLIAGVRSPLRVGASASLASAR